MSKEKGTVLAPRDGETEDQYLSRIELAVELLMVNEKKIVTILAEQAETIKEQQQAIDYLMSGYTIKQKEGRTGITVH